MPATGGGAVVGSAPIPTRSTAPLCLRRMVARESASAALLHCEFTPADIDRKARKAGCLGRPHDPVRSMQTRYKLNSGPAGRHPLHNLPRRNVRDVTIWWRFGAILADLALSAKADHR